MRSDLTNVTRITVSIVAPEPGLASPPPAPAVVQAGSARIEISWWYLPSYDVVLESPDGSETFALYLAGDEVGTGRAPAQVRSYGVDGDIAAWTEPAPFGLDAGTFTISVSCSGDAANLGGGTIHLEQVTNDGGVAEDHEATCGPASGGEENFVRVVVESGSYRIRLESVAGGLSFQISPEASH
jgi:hypothetical protein